MPESPLVEPKNLDGPQKAVFEFIEDEVPPPARHAGRNALQHLGMAERLASIDLNMAAFRAITAEEEAATALFHSLKRRGYSGSERLKPWDHRHKNAVAPFLDSIRMALGRVEQAGTVKIDMRIPRRGRSDRNPWLDIWTPQVPVGKRLQPIPPLNFNMSLNDELLDFKAEFETIVSDAGIASIEKWVRHRANKRNELLYASSEGIPRVEALNDFLIGQRNRTFQILTTLVFVDPFPEHQLFIAQCLSAFLKVVLGIEDRMDVDPPSPSQHTHG